MATRRSKTATQQAKYYEVESIFDYMLDSYINGNFSQLINLYLELSRNARADFVGYCLQDENKTVGCEVILVIVKK